MNSVVIEKNEIYKNDFINLTSKQSQHLINIVKVKIGDTLKYTCLNHCIGNAKITHIENELVSIQISTIDKGIHFPIEMIVGASRPPTLKKVIEHGTTMGIDTFHIVNCDLTEKSYLQSKVLQDDQFVELSKLGLAQSTVFFKQPKIKIHRNLKTLLDDNHIEQRFLLSPKTDESASFEEIDIEQSTIFAIGPERGWSKKEVQIFKENKFNEFSISPSVLRVETALFSLMSHLNLKMLK